MKAQIAYIAKKLTFKHKSLYLPWSGSRPSTYNLNHFFPRSNLDIILKKMWSHGHFTQENNRQKRNCRHFHFETGLFRKKNYLYYYIPIIKNKTSRVYFRSQWSVFSNHARLLRYIGSQFILIMHAYSVLLNNYL